MRQRVELLKGRITPKLLKYEVTYFYRSMLVMLTYFRFYCFCHLFLLLLWKR